MSVACATLAPKSKRIGSKRVCISIVGGFLCGEFFGGETVVALAADHAGAAGVLEDTAGINHRPGIPERFCRIGLAGRVECVRVEVEFRLVTGLQGVAEPVTAFDRVKLAGGDAVAEENAGKP